MPLAAFRCHAAADATQRHLIRAAYADTLLLFRRFRHARHIAADGQPPATPCRFLLMLLPPRR